MKAGDKPGNPDINRILAAGLVASDNPVAVFAPDDTLYFASASFRALYDVGPGTQTFSSIMRHCFLNQVGPLIVTNDIEKWLNAANEKRRSQRLRRFEIDYLDGRWMLASETTFVDGWNFVIITDITMLKTNELSLRNARDAALTAAETDHLTGMLNRGAMMNRLSRLVEACQTAERKFSVALIDLDHFKSINDTFGHDTGDAVLQHFAVCASEAIRDNDHLGRVGGEEFLLVMADAGEDQACGVLDRLRHYIQTRPFNTGKVALKYTFSAGVVEWRRGQSLEDLYSLADRMLYAAKSQGRDRLCRA